MWILQTHIFQFDKVHFVIKFIHYIDDLHYSLMLDCENHVLNYC